MNILLVEDDPVFADVLCRSLMRRGHQVSHAVNSQTVRALLPAHTFSHAILDLKLAQETSLPLIAELQQHDPAIAILVLTGYASIQTAVQAIKLGAVNYLCKPADTDTILQALCTAGADSHSPAAERPLSVERLEWEHIQKVLADNDGNISATARALAMHRRTLQRKLGKRPVRH